MRNLECPHCGGSMELRSQLDDVLNQPPENTHTYASAESLERARQQRQRKKKKKVWPWVVGILTALCLYGSFLNTRESLSHQQTGGVEPLTITETVDSAYLDTFYLDSAGGNAYTYAPSGAKSGDRVLKWIDEFDSYYDAAGDCYLGYNDTAGVWQYWYEGISSDYGDYGWMEHYDDGWFIEESDGEWVPLPASYDSSNLWYIIG